MANDSANGSVERLDTQGFTDAINSMRTAISSYQNARRNVINTTDPVMDTWEGKGKSQFEKVYKRLKTELEDDETNLQTIKKDLENILASYEQWDADTAKGIKGDNE